MRYFLTILSLILISGSIRSQDIDTFFLKYAVSKYDTIIYKRIIQFDEISRLYNVRDYYENGQIQMQASYSAFDRNMKENSWCNYRTNTKEGLYKKWFRNGQLEFTGSFKNGLQDGLCTSWYKNGRKECDKNWKNGQLDGNCLYWNEHGELQFDLTFEQGINKNPEEVNYHYIKYLPKEYKSDTLTKWPLLLYLHGGSARGTDTIDLYDYGPFDQTYRGREFPFIIIAPQCPKHIRWSTENWFENFYSEIISKYNIDTSRIFLTGVSLGGSGTWYLAVKYPEKFAAIAPISGFTNHMNYIHNNVSRLKDMPIWTFHGKLDNNVPFEETQSLVNKLNHYNKTVKFTIYPDAGHWIHHLVYPGNELYDWFTEINNGLNY